MDRKITFREGKPTSLWKALLFEGRLPTRFKSYEKFIETHRKFFFKGILKTLPLACNPNSEVEVHSIVCHADLEMYLMAIKSFLRFYDDVSVVIHGDGSLSRKDVNLLRKHIKNVKIITPEQRKKVENLSIFKKLVKQGMPKVWVIKTIEINYLNNGKKTIILDGDILFLKRPQEIIYWIKKNQDFSFYNQDIVDTLFSSRNKIEKRYKLKAPLNFNAGFIGYNSNISLKEIEKYSSLQKDYPDIDEGDQPIYQMIFAKKNPKPLDRKKYIIFNGNNYNLNVKMIHFVYYARYKQFLYLKLARKFIKELKRFKK